MNYPIPANWQDFQIFVKDLLAEKYKTKFDIYGREGQKQNGVDIFGVFEKKNIGVQCKKLGKRITTKMICDEIEKAKLFEPHLNRYMIVTTDRRDAKVQTFVANLNNDHEKQNLFEIEIVFWDDIEEEVGRNDEIWKRYYEEVLSKTNSTIKDEFILNAIQTAFSRPAFSTRFHFENKIADFLKAIQDTQEFLNTGKLRSRDGNYLFATQSYKSLADQEDVADLDFVGDVLQELRNETTAGIKYRKIKQCNDCFCVADPRTEEALDRLRHLMLSRLNRVFERHGIGVIDIPY